MIRVKNECFVIVLMLNVDCFRSNKKIVALIFNWWYPLGYDQGEIQTRLKLYTGTDDNQNN